MKTVASVALYLLIQINSFSQWNPDLNVNLVLSDTGRIENIQYNGSGYFVNWQAGMGPFSHQVAFLNPDGTYGWPASIPIHNHDLGSFTLSLQHSGLDSQGNFVAVSSYINDLGEFTCINKVDNSGAQLLNGESGIEFQGLAMGFAMGASDFMYLVVNSELKKIDPTGNVIWSVALDPGQPNNREAIILESVDGSLGVSYFVPNGGNPVYGRYYIARFDSNGNRTTTGSQQIAPANCSFYRPAYFTMNEAGEYYFIGFDTDSGISFVQHLVGDVPQIVGNGNSLDNSANSGFMTATVNGNTLHAFYQYDWNSYDQGGLKLQSIDMASGAHAFDLGQIVYESSTLVRPLRNSAVNLNGSPACLIVENLSNAVRLSEYGQTGFNSYPICTTPSVKSQSAITPLHTLTPDQQQLVVFLEDYRTTFEYPTIIAQNIVVENPGSNVSQTNVSGGLTIYPNPARQNTNLNLDTKWIGSTCRVFDPFGRMVDAFIVNKDCITLDTRHWHAGMYHIMISNDVNHQSQKLIIE